VPEKHKSLKVSMRFTQKKTYIKRQKKKRGFHYSGYRSLVVPEKHKNLKVSMRFTQKKTYIKRQLKKKRVPLFRV
jgi:hypothetical protein